MSTLVHRPAGPLSAHVTSIGYYESTGPDVLERRLPAGTMQLVINLSEDELRWYDGPDLGTVHRTAGAGLCAAIAHPIGIDTAEQRRVVTVGFRPGGAFPFFAVPASSLGEPVVGLAELWGRPGAVLRAQLLEARTPAAIVSTMQSVLLAQARHPYVAQREIAHAAGRLGRGAAVAEVAAELGMSRKRFARCFGAAVGLTPKRFARVRRLQRLLHRVAQHGRVDWARAAVDHGYFDQAHLTHDFHALTGVNPSGYRPRAAAEPNHVPVAG